ncbi:aldo/keto reductase [Actinomadura rupiterrae]|uniref:aldo/keto reductase n=1 Tax=Actinomadura rupiterrae TaxID=559627 RepID=UPI0020A2D5F9|nr:aldo/keto reductase [Actinomadura rupiterrae]MCP2341364.1 aryl-alcohol dehydrogenase-like predicted oxidoreductase [Actinomadura rupiterrae]
MTQVNLALGAMRFGSETDERTSFAILDRFVDAGGTLIDTANCYAFWTNPERESGHSERVIGAWLAARPGVRDRVRIATKVGSLPIGDGPWPENREGLSAPAIASGVADSLERLGTDRIDLLWTHMEDRSVPLEETVHALADLVDAGTVGRLGASNHVLWRVERARRIADADHRTGYTALQLRHSYLRPRPGAPVAGHNHRLGWVTDETLDYVKSEPDLVLWAYTPLLSGAYTRDDRPLPEAYDHPGTTRRLDELGKAAAELGVTRNQVVLAWLTGGTPPVTPIVGVSSTAQLDEALTGATLVLLEEIRTRLDAAT